ncbi:uncharacterized protein LOC131619549 [Vicia villosa]|uniref:uncharacterized protein LOC131619549 n=1 Tax=Vicia villosa TaxID=3911 RepID=UPI00273B1A4E|nr:uncharacterized protein LOC131619549 [Vicia villosa]
MAPPKPPNPSSKDIIEEVIQISTLNLNNAMQETQEQMDERFAKISSDLSNLHTRLENDKSVEDSRYDALMAAITKISFQKEFQQALAASSSSTVHTPATTAAAATVHGTTQHTDSVTVHHSGMVLNPPFNPRVSAPVATTLSPSNTPLRHSATFSHTQPTPMRYNTQISQPFPQYPSIPSILSTSQPFNIPFSQQLPNPQISHQSTYPNLSHIPQLPPIRTPKLELPMFDGSEPLDWMFQAEQFFNFYNMPPENRLSLISFYMKGDALSWFKWMYQSRLLTDWFSFLKALELRFGPSTFDNHQAELFKLKQDGSVVDYQTKFEKLGTQVIGLPSDAILNCFISGLTNEIQNEMAIHKPTNISQAIGLAKLIESKLKDSKPKFHKPFANTYHKPSASPANPIPKPSIIPSSQIPNPFKAQTSSAPSKLPIKRLSQAQLQERRAQGLCFNCDEKFFIGHKCSTRRFLILMADEEPIGEPIHVEDSVETEIEQDLNDTYFQLSPQALTGQFSPQTLKFKGKIGGLSVMVLVDTGSTHNILQPRIAQHLNLTSTPITQFSVMVGNGSHLKCEGICNNVPITLQKELFHLPFYLLPIEGADVVLGMAWLRTLGPLQADFSIPSISFTHHNNLITLKGDPTAHPAHTTYHQLKHLIHTNFVASFHLMFFQNQNPDPLTPNPLDTLPNPTKTLSPKIQTLLTKYKTIFQPQEGLPPARPHDHHIPLFPNTPPINVKPYRYPHSQKTAMSSIIQDMLQEGIIIPSRSPFSSPVLLVKKKDGTWRFCVDYRALNAVTIKDRFPIPTIDELLDELGNATYFTKLDLRSGYHQIRVASEDTHKTAFRTFDGHYEFLVMPFGLTNAPSTFQSAMNDLLRPYLRKFVLVFFDDILIYSANFDDHLAHLQVIFDLLKSHAFVVKLPKCVFAVKQVNYLGHIISVGGVAPDPEKVQAMLDWPTPRSLTSLRGFLGLTGFYRRFVKNYATLAAPLTDLLRSTKFVWSTEAAEAFTKLQKKMTDMPVLALPDFTKQFIIETDASGIAVGAVLSQDGHPIAFFSKKMCPRMQASSVYVREMFAVTEAVKKWRQYLIGQKFHIYTDQKSLRNLLLQRIQTPEQQKWAAKLQGFNFEIFYKPGKSNLVADALSRKFHTSDCLLLAFSSPIPDLLATLQQFYAQDTAGKLLVTQHTVENKSSLYQFTKGLLYYKDKLFIPDIEDLRLRVLQEFHHTPTGGHSGVKASLARISASFSRPGLYREVKTLVQRCTICQQNKYLTQKKKGLLQPLPIPQQVWEDLTMDFITSLPNSFGHTAIWVICDRLTKFVHFIGLPTKFTAKDLAMRFSVDIARLHGIPKSIISDRDSLFLSKFWKQFFKSQGTTLKYSTSYHPETDGQTEVVNRSLETYLRCFVGDHPRHWFKFLHLAEFWYNTSFHTAIQMTPFKALYGRDPPNLPSYLSDPNLDESLVVSLQKRHSILMELKEHLKKSRIQMEKQANKKRTDYAFKEGDLVLLKLQSYRQSTVANRSSHKLAKRFFGPFKVIKRVGTVAYLLDLPSSSRIHPVVHVSLLRPYFSDHLHETNKQLVIGVDPLIKNPKQSADKMESLTSKRNDETLSTLEQPSVPANTENRVISSRSMASNNVWNKSRNNPLSDVGPLAQIHRSERKSVGCSQQTHKILSCKEFWNANEELLRGNIEIEREVKEVADSDHNGSYVPNGSQKILSKSLEASRDIGSTNTAVSPLTLGTFRDQNTLHKARGLFPCSCTPPNHTCHDPAALSPAHISQPFIQKAFSSVPKDDRCNWLPPSPISASTESYPFQLGSTQFSSQSPNNLVSKSHSSMNLEDKVLCDPMSIDKKQPNRPIRERKPSILLKDFYY